MSNQMRYFTKEVIQVMVFFVVGLALIWAGFAGEQPVILGAGVVISNVSCLIAGHKATLMGD